MGESLGKNSPLIEGRQTLTGKLGEEVESRLLRAIQTPQAAEYVSLSSKDKRWIISRLTFSDPRWTFSVLETLQQYGGEETLPRLASFVEEGRRMGQTQKAFIPIDRWSGMPLKDTRKITLKAERGLTVLKGPNRFC